MNTVTPSNPSRIARTLLLLATLATVGCGGAKYEQRLQSTAKWYGYLAKLDRSLAIPAWKSGTITYFRPPKEFAPEFVEETSDAPTPKLPEFLSAPPEGLQAVWRADVKVSGAGTTGTAPAYLFVVDNYELLTSLSEGKRRTATKFRDRIGRALKREFGLTNDNVDGWPELRLPEPDGFGSRRSFQTIVETLPQAIDGREYELSAYAFVTGDVQGAAVYLVPAGMIGKPRMDAAIELSIRTLEPMRKAPALIATPRTGGTGAAPAGGDF